MTESTPLLSKKTCFYKNYMHKLSQVYFMLNWKFNKIGNINIKIYNIKIYKFKLGK